MKRNGGTPELQNSICAPSSTARFGGSPSGLDRRRRRDHLNRLDRVRRPPRARYLEVKRLPIPEAAPCRHRLRPFMPSKRDKIPADELYDLREPDLVARCARARCVAPGILTWARLRPGIPAASFAAFRGNGALDAYAPRRLSAA